MKTPEQLEAIAKGKAWLDHEKERIEELVKLACEIDDAYTPLTGKGNTHGDNLDVAFYSKTIMNQVTMLLQRIDVDEAREIKNSLYEKYFEGKQRCIKFNAIY